jgi:hypothetical protein
VILAVNTTASPVAIWAIVIVAVLCLAFWLGAVAWADMHPIVRQRQVPKMPGPVLGGMHVAEGGRSVAPHREGPPVLAVPGQRGAEPAPAPSQNVGQPMQVQNAGQQGGVQGMPAQRTGEADRPERTTAGGGSADQPRDDG